MAKKRRFAARREIKTTGTVALGSALAAMAKSPPAPSKKKKKNKPDKEKPPE